MAFFPKLVGWPLVQDFRSVLVLVKIVDLTYLSKLVGLELEFGLMICIRNVLLCLSIPQVQKSGHLEFLQ